jgi:isopenicillin N synthase-like dioxygenase
LTQLTTKAIDFFRPVNQSKPPYATGQGINQWPTKPVHFREVAEAYIDHMESLGRKVIEAIALGLGVDAGLLLDRVDKAFWNLRVLGYEGRQERTPAKAGIGEHTGYIYQGTWLGDAELTCELDFGILTFLLTDPTPGALQVLGKDGEWMDADPIEVSFALSVLVEILGGF